MKKNNIRELTYFHEYNKLIEALCEPVVIRQTSELADVVKRWNLPFLSSVLGDKEVIVSESRDGVHRLNTKTGKINSTEMPFKKYIERLESQDENGNKLYLQQMPIKALCPELLADFIFVSNYLKDKKDIIMNIWIGPKNAISPLHFDYENNFLIQLHGKKKIRLYSPSQTKYLYPRPSFLKFNHISKINMEEPCPKEFPKFYNAVPQDVILNPGDILYIPPFWWHKAYGLTTNISTNVWWPGKLKQYPFPLLAHGLARLSRTFLFRAKILVSKMTNKYFKSCAKND